MTILGHLIFDGETATVADTSDARLRCVVFSVDAAVDAAAAITKAKTVFPEARTVDGETLIRGKIRVTKQTGPRSWELEAEYSNDEADKENQDEPEAGTWSLEWDTGKATHKTVLAKEKISSDTKSAGLYPLKDVHLTMSWDGHEAKGLDLPVAEPTFTITKYYAPNLITTNTFKLLCEKCSPPHTNELTWLGFTRCEVAFLGAKAKAEMPLKFGLPATKPVPITLSFGYSPTKVNIVLDRNPAGASIFECPQKRGWEVLDVRYMKELDGDTLIPRPIHYHVWRVFDELDYATFFGIG